MHRLFDVFRSGEATRMSSDAAIAVARHSAQTQGWAIVEPVRATLRRDWFGHPKHWTIETNINARGGPKARFVINATEGDILQQGYVSP